MRMRFATQQKNKTRPAGMCWGQVDPQIHTEYFHSGGATAWISLWMGPPQSVPHPDTVIICTPARPSKHVRHKKKRCIKTYQGSGVAKHEGDSWGKPFTSLNSSSTTIRNVSFATFHADRKSWFNIFQPLRPTEGNPWEQIPSTSTALSDTRSVTDESSSKSKDAEKFEFESWPQASTLSSWNLCFRREDTTGSTHPRLVSEWFAEIDLASSMGVLDYSGFVFDKHQFEFETLQRLPKESWRLFRPNLRERSISWRRLNTNTNSPMVTGRQSMFQVFLFFNISEVQELQEKNIYTHEARDDFISARHCSEKGAEKRPQSEDDGQWHPRAATAEHVDFSNKKTIKRQSSSSILFERS